MVLIGKEVWRSHQIIFLFQH